MLKKTREELNRLAGKPAPLPVPVAIPAAPAAAPQPDLAPAMDQIGQALSMVAQQQQETAQALAAIARPKRMHADFERDSKGRITRAVINIIS